MQNINLSHISINKITLPSFIENGIEADVLRLDKIHPVISGNKWFKLRYYLEDAKDQDKKTIATFGGAWSNHIIATAAACHLNGFKAIGIIRGEEPFKPSSILQYAKELNMQLIFISRNEYKQKKLPADINDDAYIINEGGFGIKGVEGAATILDHCQKEKYTHICCATGTGTMAAGIAKVANAGTKIIGVSVLKNNPEIEDNITSLQWKGKKQPEIMHDYHFGGYAKHKPELLDFMNEFYRQTSIPSDFVYTGKLFYAIADLAAKKYFLPGSSLLLIHSGGLQGNSSLDNGKLIF